MPDPILTVGNYQVAREIGRGSFATVYKAYSKTNRTPVAIKAVLRSKLTKKLLESLETEIAILKAIRHNHIVQLVDCQKSDTHIHLIMEFCSLGDLSNYIKKKGDIPGIGRYPNAPPVGNLAGGLNEYVVRHFLKQLASALEFLRSQNLIHRDLKPQNLLLLPPPAIDSKTTDRYIAALPYLKVADFGFARFLPSQTLAETLCGSPLYMAPEILRYEKYDAKADLWSVGAVLYEMLVGKSPFRAQNHVELLRRIERGGDQIRFPGEDKSDRRSSHSVAPGTSPSLTPPLAKRSSSPSLSQSSSSRSVPIAPQISEEIKELVRQLLKRNPIERISFEEFFLNPCITGEISIPPFSSFGQHAPSTASSPSIPIVQYSSSSPLRQIHEQPISGSGPSGYPTLQNQQPMHRHHDPSSVPRRASHVPTVAHGGRPKLERNHTVSPLMERRGSGGVAAEIGTWRESGTPQQSTSTEATAYPIQRNRLTPAVPEPQPSSLPTYMVPGRDGMRPRSQTLANISPRTQRIADSRRASEITMDPWDKDEAAGRQRKERQVYARLPTADEVTDEGNDGEEDGGFEKEYVVVEKRTVEVNSLADELAASPKFSSRVSSRLTSPPGTPIFSASIPRDNKYISRDQHDGSLNPPLSSLDILSTTPPFAKGGAPSRQVVRSTSIPSVASPSSLKTNSGDHGSGWTSHTATSKLAKAISTASARLFGSPTPSGNVGLGMVGGLTAAAVATGLGFGTSPPFLFGDMGPGSSGMAMVLFEGGVDPEEESILKTIEEYAQRAYVIVQFADSKVSALSSQRPRNSSQQPIIHEYQRQEQPPDPSATTIPTTTTGISTSLQRLDSGTTNRTGAEEALVLYVKALAILQMGMDVAKRYWSGDDKETSEKGKRRENRMPSVRLNNAVQWTRDCFNECLEKAEFVKTKCGFEGGGGQCAEKLIYDRAAEISRAAAVNELVGEDLMSCEVSYRTAVLLMKTLLEGPYEDGERMEEDDREVISKFTASIESRLTALNQRLEMMTSRCSMGGGGASTSTIASGAGGDGGTRGKAEKKDIPWVSHAKNEEFYCP